MFDLNVTERGGMEVESGKLILTMYVMQGMDCSIKWVSVR